MSGRNQDGAKLFASVEGRKLHGAKITPYTVFLYLIIIHGFTNQMLKFKVDLRGTLLTTQAP